MLIESRWLYVSIFFVDSSRQNEKYNVKFDPNLEKDQEKPTKNGEAKKAQ